jgi:hypothetical protein
LVRYKTILVMARPQSASTFNAFKQTKYQNQIK